MNENTEPLEEKEAEHITQYDEWYKNLERPTKINKEGSHIL